LQDYSKNQGHLPEPRSIHLEYTFLSEFDTDSTCDISTTDVYRDATSITLNTVLGGVARRSSMNVICLYVMYFCTESYRLGESPYPEFPGSHYCCFYIGLWAFSIPEKRISPHSISNFLPQIELRLVLCPFLPFSSNSLHPVGEPPNSRPIEGFGTSDMPIISLCALRRLRA